MLCCDGTGPILLRATKKNKMASFIHCSYEKIYNLYIKEISHNYRIIMSHLAIPSVYVKRMKILS